MLESYALFFTASLLLLVVPGPDMLAIVSRGVNMGKKMAFVTTIGYLIGDLIQTLLVALGLAAFLAAHPMMLDILRLAGAAYLVYLGIASIVHRGTQSLGQPGTSQTNHWGQVLRQSIVASVINPKTALFFIAFLPQFVKAELGHPTLQILMLGVLFAVIAFAAYAPVAWCAGSLGQYLNRSPRIQRWLPWVSGSIFIGLGVTLAFNPSNVSES
ncbi:LysE family translocator [Comamonas suwonensis]|uniref:LysE family translocator n=1 Tax=Comamonas suwonensis TaxID=2606214 RepID=A0A843BES3_9BURK|nr:LysE family translocator [Comamonas suwonensis]MBI1625468.1 LysE family translocator [Comamonas suwonensis]